LRAPLPPIKIEKAKSREAAAKGGKMAVREAFPVLILGVIGTLARVGAQSATPDPAQAVRTFRFVATDAKGQPVTDLRPDEVQVSDGGKHDRLAFSRLLLPALPAPAALGPREFSNRAGGQLATSTLILIDLFNASFTEHSTAWDQTIQTLEKLESSENVFLFLVAPDASLFAIHAPGAPTEPPSGPWTRQIRDLLDQGLRTVEKLKHADSADADVIASLTDQALKTLGAQYAALPGQKRLIWVTRGMPLTVIGPNGPLPLVFQPLLQQTAEEYRQLGIQIYTVHQKESNTSNVDRAKALDSLAPLTGGRSFEDEAVGRAIAEAQTDARAAYEAGYYTNDKDADGKLHKLRVSTTRKGARILAADGYTAEPLETI
jgi:VWFA-related protein